MASLANSSRVPQVGFPLATLMLLGLLGWAAPARAQLAASESNADPSGEPSSLPRDDGDAPPTPLAVDYAQYGVALGTEIPINTGGTCPDEAEVPCILGIGGGPVLRGAYRPAGPWLFGAAYQFSKLDSNNLYRLGILQQLRAEGRFYIATGTRFDPYLGWSLGGMVYGNEFSVETGGVTTSLGAGVEFEVTRFAVVGLSAAYQPMLFAGFTDSAGQQRDLGLAQYMHLELVVELRSELSRE